MPTAEQVRLDLAEILHEVVGAEPDTVSTEARFVEDLDVDSLSMIEVLVAAEERFGVPVPDDRVAGLKTVGDAVSYLEQALA